MTEKFSKREFVDENPYLVYTSEDDKVFRIENGSIGTAQIADGAITTGKIANGAVTASQIASGVIPEPYTLPTASNSTLGGVKVGDGLSIADGVLSASGGGIVEIPFEFDANTHQPTCTKTASEIIEIIESGKNIIGILEIVDGLSSNTDCTYFSVFNYYDAESDSYVGFCGFTSAVNGFKAAYAKVTNSGTEFTSYTLSS